MNPIPHGTREGYRRCKVLLGEACNRCKKAEADYLKEWRKKNGDAAKRVKARADIRQKAKTILSQRYKDEYLELVTMLETKEMEKEVV